jgi:subtilisin family serine protease
MHTLAALLMTLSGVALGAEPGHVPGEVILELPGASDDDADVLARAHGCRLERRLGGWHPYFLLSCDPAQPVAALVQHFAEQPGVRDASPNLVGRPHATPDDLSSAQWHHGVMDSEDAWDVSTGDPSVVVAVIDVGTWLDHDDLADNAWSNPAETDCDDGVDDDGNGYVDDCRGWDGGEGDGDPDPRSLPSDCPPFHGTFAAGLIGAVGDNGAGIAGVNWDVSVMGLKIVTDDCAITQAGFVDTVLYAADNGATVGNMSFSFSASNGILEGAFRYADGLGMISTISAGNDGIDLDAETWYPAAYELDHALVVAATDSSDARASWSNYGATSVDLAAPGANIYSLGVDSASDYETSNGTSFSAPLVAGAAALVQAAYPELYPDEVVASIYDGVEAVSGLDCGSTAACVSSGGRLHLPGALDQAALWMEHVQVDLVGWAVAEDDDGDGVLERGEAASLMLELENTGHASSGVLNLALTGAADGLALVESSGEQAALEAGELASPTLFEIELSTACEADVDADLTVSWSDGASSWSETITLPLACIVDDDGDGSLYPDDCDDLDPAVLPGAEEWCNGVDDDCDEQIDEEASDAVAWYADADGDGFGDPEAELWACDHASGWVEDASDCDDADAGVHPDAQESCTGVDDDCDGLVDDEDDGVADQSSWYLDDDGDGYGVEVETLQACDAPSGYAAQAGDCDDADPALTTDCSEQEPTGCGCASSGSAAGWWLGLVALVGPRRRGRR